MNLNDIQNKLTNFSVKLQNNLEPSNMSLATRRIIAKFLDFVFIFSCIMILCMPIIIMSTILPKVLVSFFLAVIFLLGALCVLFVDGPYTIAVFDQQSIGKKFMGLKIVYQNSEQSISYFSSAKRNLLLASPYFALFFFCLLEFASLEFLKDYKFYIFGFLLLVITITSYGIELYTFLTSPQNIRYGDSLANTKVVNVV